MPRLDEKHEPMLAMARRLTDRYHVAFSVLTQGENSPHMTEEFKQRLAGAKKKLAPYMTAGRGKAEPSA
jgi:hypothetical protein